VVSVGYHVPLAGQRPCRGAIAVALAVLALAVPGGGRAFGGGASARSSLDEVVDRLVRQGAPGAIALVRTSAGVDRAAAGLARITPPLAMTATDRFRIASVTKTFVATLVLQLATEGRLRLSDPLARWLPGLVPNGQSITLRDLLAHTSGLFDYDADRGWITQRIARPARVWSARELIAVAVKHPPLFRPGTSWSYSNTNYVLLGLVVEAATRHSLGQELRKRIFYRLGLRATSYPPRASMPGRVAHGYLGSAPGLPIAPGRLVDVTSAVSPSSWGAGQIVSNGDDVTRFLAALFRGRLLSPVQLAAMKKRVTTVHLEQGVPVEHTADYGLGLSIERTPCGTAYGHDGDIPGYRNLAWASSDGRRAISVMVNVTSTRVSWPLVRAAAAQAFCSR
jgi:D-alanyl-D-alanine carboxypeptidase